jgi:holo-[acyl-carrier protein] synthase
LGSRFAAKEAAAKALGTGFAQGITWKCLQVYSLPSGQPKLALHDKALNLAQDLEVDALHLSLTHERGMAAAMVILEKF